MSERLEHEEDLPVIRLRTDSGALELTPENSSLFLFLGRLACYSHVFVETGETDDGKMIGSYLFASHDVFKDVSAFMTSRGYPMHVNLREVPDCDINAFNSMVAQQTEEIGDTIPDDWLEGGDGTQT